MSRVRVESMDIPSVAVWHRRLIALVGVRVLVLATLFALPAMGVTAKRQDLPVKAGDIYLGLWALDIVMFVLAVVCLANLMKAMRSETWKRVAACVLLLVPLVGLIVMMAYSQRATGALRAAGYRVGLFGAKGRARP